MNLNKRQWRKFKVSDIFEINRGKRLKSTDRKKGNLEYYSASSMNNGLTDKISNPLFVENKKIIVSSFLDIFYVNNNFTASDEINIFSLKGLEINQYLALFIITIMKNLKEKYSFGRKAFYKRLIKEYISLPVDENNNPDWKFMEEYIKYRAQNIIFKQKRLENFKQTKFLNKRQWKQFKVSDIFEIKGSGKSKAKKDVNNYGKYNLISTQNTNNGIIGKSSFYNNKGNVLTFESAVLGSIHYQSTKFVGTDHVEKLILKKYELNKYIALFLKTILNNYLPYYNFGRKRSQKRMKNELLYLPVDENNNPDWKFIEEYIKERATQILF